MKSSFYKALLGPFPRHEVFFHGLRWEPSNSALPMSIRVGRTLQVITALIFLPFCFLALLFSLGIVAALFLYEVNIPLLFVGLGFFLLAIFGFWYCIARLCSETIVTITHETVSFRQKYPWTTRSWEEPLGNYLGVQLYFSSGAGMRGAKRAWCVVLLHPARDRTIPLQWINDVVSFREGKNTKEQEAIPARKRFAAILKVPEVEQVLYG